MIISDTEYYKDSKDCYLFHSVNHELYSLSSQFDEYIFFGWKIENNNAQYLLVDFNKFSPIGISINKTNKLRFYCINIRSTLKIINSIKGSKYIHVRGPSFPMLVALLVAPFFKYRKFWFKYANAWNETGRSKLWDFQKWLLIRNQHIKVTVNGNWINLPKHIVPFENPCFYQSDLMQNQGVWKDFDQPKKLVFVGRFTSEKGIFRILEGLESIEFEKVESLKFVGDGPEFEKLSQKVLNHPLKQKIEIIGSQTKAEVMSILQDAHFLLLPTISPEGFPKVVAEAWVSRCIPVVSDISSIPQYVIEGETGILWCREEENWNSAVIRAFDMDNFRADNMFQNINELLPRFTYEYFGDRIKKEVFEFEE